METMQRFVVRFAVEPGILSILGRHLAAVKSEEAFPDRIARKDGER
jgi:hypothetical protein